MRETTAARARRTLRSKVRRVVPLGADGGVAMVSESGRLLRSPLRAGSGSTPEPGSSSSQDFRILASPLREPGDDQQNRPNEEDRKTDDLRRDRGAFAVGSLHDEPLGQARDHGPRDTEEPGNVPVWEEVHLSAFEVPVHVFAPRLLSIRPYQYMTPMKTRPITTWATKPPTAHGQGVSRRKVPENGEPAILTPASGSTTGPLAFVKRPYSVGIGGLPLTPLTVGAAGMFPTFCTETPTWRWRKVGWMDRTTSVALYWVFGVSANDDEPIH